MNKDLKLFNKYEITILFSKLNRIVCIMTSILVLKNRQISVLCSTWLLIIHKGYHYDQISRIMC